MQWLNPGFWLGVLILSIVLFGGGYAAGHKAASSACIVREAQAQQASQRMTDEINALREQIAQAREASGERIRIVYRTLREKAHEISVADCGLDADGLRLWNAANSGTTTPLRGQPDGGVPGATPGANGKAVRSAGKSYRGDGVVRAVPGSDGQTGGVRAQ